jgi:hypothetical protein
MSMKSIRAKIRHKNSDIHLGYYQTQAQATAAKAGAHAALDKWEILHPPKPAPKQKLPSIETLTHFVSQGIYDSEIQELGEMIVARANLIRRMKQASKAKAGRFDFASPAEDFDILI